jgi:hypothetical protein
MYTYSIKDVAMTIDMCAPLFPPADQHLHTYIHACMHTHTHMYTYSINDVAMTIDMCAPLFPQYFLPLISISAAFKACCGVSAGACNNAILQHLSVK